MERIGRGSGAVLVGWCKYRRRWKLRIYGAEWGGTGSISCLMHLGSERPNGRKSGLLCKPLSLSDLRLLSAGTM